jgi:hypothetical protein
MPNATKAICAACALCMTILCLQGVSIGTELRSITLAWEWYSGNSNYTAGPDGDVAFDIYVCDEDDADCTYDDPVIGVVDDCWWNVDHYRCQTTMDYEFERGVYYIYVIAYLLNEPNQRSAKSNEVRYVVKSDDGTSQASSSGGGCFIGSVLGFCKANRLRNCF